MGHQQDLCQVFPPPQRLYAPRGRVHGAGCWSRASPGHNVRPAHPHQDHHHLGGEVLAVPPVPGHNAPVYDHQKETATPGGAGSGPPTQLSSLADHDDDDDDDDEDDTWRGLQRPSYTVVQHSDLKTYLRTP